MRLSQVTAAAVSIGFAAVGASQIGHSDDTCSNLISTGEILHLSLNLIEFPVIVDVDLEEDTVVTIDNTILIECTNAPTHLHTTVYATTTNTVTKTISTATITGNGVMATAAGSVTSEKDESSPVTDVAVGNGQGHTVSTKIGTKTNGPKP